MLKKLFMYTRRSIKLVILISVALLIVVGVIGSFYKVSYIVNIDGEMVGYTDNKSKLQSQINDYIENGEDENAAFVQIESLPEYNMCLLKRDVNSDDDKIFNIIKSDGTTYYRYYAILDNQEEKVYVSNFSEAESIVAKLKEKKSSNTEKITIAEKYETELKEMTSIDDAVSKLYVAPPKKVVVAKKQVNTSTTISNNKVSLGISLSRPVSGIITSRFGVNSSVRSSSHTGLDIATSLGTPVMAAASGTVSYAGWKGSYGKLAVITHENGIQTYYGHCNALYVTAGQTVAQGQTIAAVGSTGNSTGPHLHYSCIYCIIFNNYFSMFFQFKFKIFSKC